jgi:acyl-CoA thioesterase I
MQRFSFLLVLTLCLWPPLLSPANTQTKDSEPLLIFLGDSLTEGYGVKKEAAFPALIEEKIRQSGKKWRLLNMGVSGSTSASAEGRMRWALRLKPEIVFLALGANDGLRGVKPSVTSQNLKKAVALAKEKQVKVFLAGMEMPPNYGKSFRDEFRAAFSTVAKEENLPFLPFLLEGVGGVPKYNLEDGIHPNEMGHRKIADLVFSFLKDKL